MRKATVAAPNERPAEARDLDPARLGRIAFNHFTDRDGLPQNAIQAMAFDRKGYLWVGTQDGAAYYNGRVWTVVNMPNRTVSNFVRSILVASDESIWFGRQEGGVSRLRDSAWTTFDEKSILPDKRVNALLETRTSEGAQVIWIGTDKGLAQLEGEEWRRFDAQSGLPDDRVTSLVETKERDGVSVVWVGTDKGLARFSQGEWKTFNKQNGLLQESVTSLLATTDEMGRGILWTGTVDGLARFDLDENRWTAFDALSGSPTSTVACLAQTVEPGGGRVLWVGMDGGGLARYEAGNWIMFGTREGLSSNSVFSLLPGAGGGPTETLWIGTDGGGLARLPMGGWRSFTTANGLPASSVYCIFETLESTGRAMWFGTYGGGLARLRNGAWTIFDKSTGMPDNTVFEMLATTLDDGQRVLWAGTKGAGLARFENGRWVKHEIEKSFGESTVRHMLATTDEEGARVVWVASGARGLGRLRKGEWTFFDTSNGLPHKSVFELAESVDADGTRVLWVATGGGGVARYAKNRWKVFDVSTGLPTNSVLSLLVDRTPEGREYLWAGTEGGGVSRLELNNHEETPHWMTLSDTTTPALPNNTIYQIRQDAQGRIYLSHNKGVTRLTPRRATSASDGATKDKAEEYDVYTFTTEDGLPSNEGNGGVSFVDSEGRIWVGTVGGAAVFDPAQELSDTAAKPLYIEQTLVNEKPRALAGQQALAHHENHLTFEYALLSFAHGEGTRYRTQLIGLEREPSTWTSDSKKDYTALPPGDYTFTVWGRDYTGNVTRPAIISFKIKPALWRTWWAYTLYAGLLVGLAFVGVRYRTKSLTRRNTLLQAKVDERTHELAEKVEQLKESEQRAYLYAQAKSQFLANMSHEIRTPINGVIGMTSLLLETPLNGEQRERAELVKRSGDMLLTIINDILDFSKIEAGKLELETIDFELTIAIEDVLELIARKAQSKGLELASFIAPGVPQFLRGDPIRLRQILINLVDNAIKFTERGEVSLRAQLVEETADTVTLRYEVRDTGIGIKPEVLNNLFMPFTQADSSTTRRYGGTGLGLTIAKQLVELMAGELGAESVEGRGSCFRFTARFAKSAAMEVERPVAATFRGRRALYIGLSGTLRDSVLSQLAAWEMEAAAAADAAGALAALGEGSVYDLLIIDSRLSDMDGLDLARTLSFEAAISNTPIILLTPLAERRETMGRFHILTKPVRRAQLFERLCEALKLIPDQTSAASLSFSSNLPVREAGALEGDSSSESAEVLVAGGSVQVALKDFRLLLVEDNLTNQQVAVATLAQMGYEIDSVSNGREAIAALREADYDLVFMDCHMPEMDGFEATAEIRRHERASRRTPIIAMTASALPEDRERCLAVGMDDYLTKPVRRDELHAVIQRWLHETGGHAAASLPALETLAVVSLEPRPLESEALHRLRDLGGTNHSFICELIDLFLKESVERLARISEAVTDGDIKAIRHLAHTQRGASLNFGANVLAQLCAELENIGTSTPQTAQGVAHELLTRIEREFLDVRRALEAERITALESLPNLPGAS